MTRLLGFQRIKIGERARCEACPFLYPEVGTKKNPDICNTGHVIRTRYVIQVSIVAIFVILCIAKPISLYHKLEDVIQ